MAQSRAMIRVLIADDHALFRAGLAAVVGCQPDMVVVGEAADGRQAVALCGTQTPHVVLLDMQMPVTGGLEALPLIRQAQPDVRIIMISAYGGDVPMARARLLGASRYLLKDSLRADLTEAIRASVQRPNDVVPEDGPGHVGTNACEPLSSRETDVLERIAMGMSNEDISCALSISLGAVNGRVRRILAKLSARDRTHAVVIAYKRGIIPV